MKDCTFKNINYGLNSVVRLGEDTGIVQIENSVFSNVNLCGAVVSNTFKNLNTTDYGTFTGASSKNDVNLESLSAMIIVYDNYFQEYESKMYA